MGKELYEKGRARWGVRGDEYVLSTFGPVTAKQFAEAIRRRKFEDPTEGERLLAALRPKFDYCFRFLARGGIITARGLPLTGIGIPDQVKAEVNADFIAQRTVMDLMREGLPLEDILPQTGVVFVRPDTLRNVGYTIGNKGALRFGLFDSHQEPIRPDKLSYIYRAFAAYFGTVPNVQQSARWGVGPKTVAKVFFTQMSLEYGRNNASLQSTTTR